MPDTVDTLTPEAAQAQLATLTTDPGFVTRFNSSDAVVRGEAIAETQRLNRIAYPHEIDDDGFTVTAQASASTELFEPPPASPDAYRFDYDTRLPVDSADDRELREIFLAAALPQSIAKQFFDTHKKELARAATTGKALTEADVVLGQRATEFKLREAWGAEFDNKMAAARSVFTTLPPDKRTAFMRVMGKSPLMGNDELLIRRLAAFGEERARQKK